ncbi:hypothetical protein NKDENANG_01368 [Candidatus Entotheonellaceae bacterium PAL068K]
MNRRKITIRCSGMARQDLKSPVIDQFEQTARLTLPYLSSGNIFSGFRGDNRTTPES